MHQQQSLDPVILTSMSGAAVVTAIAPAAAPSLGDFDNLQSDQLDLGAAILQHLLSCGQHLILDKDRHHIKTTSTLHHCSCIFSLFPLNQCAGIGAHSQTTHSYQNKWQDMRKSTATVLSCTHTHSISDKNKCQKKGWIR